MRGVGSPSSFFCTFCACGRVAFSPRGEIFTRSGFWARNWHWRALKYCGSPIFSDLAQSGETFRHFAYLILARGVDSSALRRGGRALPVLFRGTARRNCRFCVVSRGRYWGQPRCSPSAPRVASTRGRTAPLDAYVGAVCSFLSQRARNFGVGWFLP